MQKCPYHTRDVSDQIIEGAYKTISHFYEQAILLEDEAKKYNNLETLFDLQKFGYNQLKDCRSELRSLKYLWDMIQLIHFQFNAWKLTL